MTDKNTTSSCHYLATSLDFTGTHRVPLVLAVPQSTLAILSRAAAERKLQLDDFVVLAAYITARDQLALEFDRTPKLPCLS